MAFNKSLIQRLFNVSRITSPASGNGWISSPQASARAAALNFHETPNNLVHDPGDNGVYRRYFYSHSASKSPPEIRFFPTGEKLLEKLRGMDVARERIRLDDLRPPVEEEEPGEVTVDDARKILLLSQLEMVKSRLRQIEKSCLSYSEFLQICVKEASNEEQGIEFSKLLDKSGAVIVLGNTVFLRPQQVMKAIQGLIPLPSSHNAPSDPKTLEEFQEMEQRKEAIDKKAESIAKRELWCGLGFLVVQTAAFMRLTFWELTWDVMEPICFYVTSTYFMCGYAFFLRTTKEPSFEGFFQSRFNTKQRRLMKLQNFDLERYNELKRACYSYSPAPRERDLSFGSSILDHSQRT
ncbi:calcium uniporter protein 2, mitochondrial-like [Primulina huaijiensis]|uniref:calcium uniporter protein 2, mitochondrial-like n=1 Tax=Primulina huaijiensis TaxID=1492673 RepID=UPI003CC710BD